MKPRAIALIALIILLSSFSYILKEYIAQRSEIVRLNDNIVNLGVDNSTLRLTAKELENYMEDLNTAHKIEIDSITKLLKIKPKQVISYITVENVISDTVEVEIPLDNTNHSKDTTFSFNINKGCLDISGRIKSTDPDTKLFVDSVHGSNKTYIVKHYKKSFWDFVFFRKGKETISTTSDCGESVIEEIIID